MKFPAAISTVSSVLSLLALSQAKPVKKAGLGEPAFVLVGDSTTNNNTVTPNCKYPAPSVSIVGRTDNDGSYFVAGGWGNGFCESLKEGLHCSNYGSNGATSGTIVERGLYGQALDRVREQVGLGKVVFVTLQFGHSMSRSQDAVPIERTNLMRLDCVAQTIRRSDLPSQWPLI